MSYRDESNQSNIDNPIIDFKNHCESFNVDVTGIMNRLKDMAPSEDDPTPTPEAIQKCTPSNISVFHIYKNELLARFKPKVPLGGGSISNDDFPMITEQFTESPSNWFSSLNLIPVKEYKTSQILLQKLHIWGISADFYDFKKQGVQETTRKGIKNHPGTAVKVWTFGRCKIMNTIYEPLVLDNDTGKYALDGNDKLIIPKGMASQPGLLLKPRIWYYNTTLKTTVGSAEYDKYYNPATIQWFTFNRSTLPNSLQQTKKVGIYWEPVEKSTAKKCKRLYDRYNLHMDNDIAFEKAYVETREGNYPMFRCTNAVEFGKEMEGVLLL